MKKVFLLSIATLLFSTAFISCKKSDKGSTCHCIYQGKVINIPESGSDAEDECSSQENEYQATDSTATCTLQ